MVEAILITIIVGLMTTVVWALCWWRVKLRHYEAVEKTNDIKRVELGLKLDNDQKYKAVCDAEAVKDQASAKAMDSRLKYTTYLVNNADAVKGIVESAPTPPPRDDTNWMKESWESADD